MIAYVLLRGDEGTRGWMGASETGDEYGAVFNLDQSVPQIISGDSIGSGYKLPTAPSCSHRSSPTSPVPLFYRPYVAT
jgi:hypothetical protein